MNRGAGVAVTVLSLLAALACGGDGAGGGGSDEGPRGPFELADGVSVRVSQAGELSVLAGGRTLLRLPRGLRAARYQEEVRAAFGSWSFERTGVETFAADTFVEARRQGDGVRVSYGGQGQAVVEVRPLRPGATLVRASFAGVEGLRSLTLPVGCDAEATFYGLGEQYNAAEQRGEAFTLFVSEQGIGRDPAKKPFGVNGGPHTTYFPMPYYLDARGHGALLRTPFRVDVDLCRGDASLATFEAASAQDLEAVVFHGPTPLDVVRQLGDEVGRPRRPPPWAHELWMTTQGGRQAVLEQVAAFEQAQLPLRAVWVQDWTGARKNADGGYGVQYRWVADEGLYPDLRGMIAGLHERGYRVLTYANPFVIKGLDHHDAMAQKGLLLTRAGGEVYEDFSPGGAAAHPDFTAPGTRDYIRSFFTRMAVDDGMDGWMEDFGEWAPLDARNAAGVDPEAYHNTFPVEWHRTSAEALAGAGRDADTVIFARSGYTGVQRHAQVFWVGDQEADFSPHDGLPTVVPAMLSLGISGLPFVTHDVAGFSGGPSSRELFWRWVELGAFTPIFRTHDGNDRENNWSWNKDAATRAHFARFARVHQALVPELQAAAEEAARTGKPLVRHLMLSYPDDPGSRQVHDQYLLGDGLLVAPVVTEGATSRRVYLPPGAWFDVWTGERFDGGASVEVAAPLGSPPVFAAGQDRPDLRAVQ